MRSRGARVLFFVAAVVVGIGAACATRSLKSGSSTATVTESPSPSTEASAAPSAAPSPQASPAATPSPTAEPTRAPTQTPAPGGGSGGGGGPAAYPAQIQAGSSYSYGGSGTFAVFAADSRDSGSKVCAGINETTQDFPAGYAGFYFVGITFPDGAVLSAGYVRSNQERHDFGSDQRGSSRQGNHGASSATSAAHTYCVGYGSGAWTMTSDGNVVYSTSDESATSTAGATIRFQTGVTYFDTSQPASGGFQLVVPGFHDLSIDGSAPTQLSGGSTRY